MPLKQTNNWLANAKIENGKIIADTNFSRSSGGSSGINIQDEAGMGDVFIMQRYMRIVSALAGVVKLGQIIKQNPEKNIEKIQVEMEIDSFVRKNAPYPKFLKVELVDKNGKRVNYAQLHGENYQFNAVRSGGDWFVESDFADALAYDCFEQYITDDDKSFTGFIITPELLALLENSGEHNIESLYQLIKDGNYNLSLNDKDNNAPGLKI